MCASASRALSNPRLNSPAVQARVGVLIVHPGSRAQHLQMPNRRLNSQRAKVRLARVDIFRVFSGDFAVRMSALRESAR